MITKTLKEIKKIYDETEVQESARGLHLPQGLPRVRMREEAEGGGGNEKARHGRRGRTCGQPPQQERETQDNRKNIALCYGRMP